MARTKVKKTLAQKKVENGNKPRAKSKYARKLERRKKERDAEK